MNLTEQAQQCAADLAVIAANMGRLVSDIDDATGGQPAAQRFGPTQGGKTVMWCWTHEREVTHCHEVDLSCSGEPIELHDPTGEAGVRAANGEDRAAGHKKELKRLLDSVGRDIERLLKIDGAYKPMKQSSDRAGIGSCTDCHRYFDGAKGARISSYRGGDPVCIGCRTARDRRKSIEPCPSELTHEMRAIRCDLPAGHSGQHRGDGWSWSGVTGEREAVAS